MKAVIRIFFLNRVLHSLLALQRQGVVAGKLDRYVIVNRAILTSHNVGTLIDIDAFSGSFLYQSRQLVGIDLSGKRVVHDRAAGKLNIQPRAEDHIKDYADQQYGDRNPEENLLIFYKSNFKLMEFHSAPPPYQDFLRMNLYPDREESIRREAVTPMRKLPMTPTSRV